MSIHRQQDPRNRARQAPHTNTSTPAAKCLENSVVFPRRAQRPGLVACTRVMSPSPPTTLDSAKRHPLRTTTSEQARGKTKLHPLTSRTCPARLPQKGKQMMMMPAPFVIACRPTRHQPYFLHQCRLAKHPHLDYLLNKEPSQALTDPKGFFFFFNYAGCVVIQNANPDAKLRHFPSAIKLIGRVNGVSFSNFSVLCGLGSRQDETPRKRAACHFPRNARPAMPGRTQ